MVNRDNSICFLWSPLVAARRIYSHRVAWHGIWNFQFADIVHERPAATTERPSNLDNSPWVSFLHWYTCKKSPIGWSLHIQGALTLLWFLIAFVIYSADEVCFRRLGVPCLSHFATITCSNALYSREQICHCQRSGSFALCFYGGENSKIPHEDLRSVPSSSCSPPWPGEMIFYDTTIWP